MSLRAKFIIIIITVIIMMMIAVFAIAQGIIINNAEKLEIRNARNVIERTSKIIQTRIDTLANTARDYAVWDDTYNYVTNPDDTYIRSNYVDETFNINKLDIIGIYSKQNSRLFSKTYSFELSDSMAIDILNEVLLMANQQQRSGIYVTSEGRIYMFAAHPITTSNEKEPSNGLMVMIRELGDAEKGFIQDQVGIKIEWLPFEQNDEVLELSHITSASTVIPSSGKIGLSIRVQIPRDITKSIADARNIIITVMIAIAVVAIIGTYAFVNDIVIKPLNQVMINVQNINTLGSNELYIQLNTNDEFEMLAGEINHMLVKLKSSQDGLLKAQTEIAKQKAIEEKKDEFFSIASHELRTPLTAIRGNVEYLKKAYATVLNQNVGLQEALTDMQNASMRLIDLVNDFLTTSRIDQNKMTPLLGEYDVQTALTNALNSLSQLANQKGLSIFVHFPNETIHMRVDLQFFTQIIENIVGNSIKYTPPGGRITVNIDADEQLVHFSVSDTGRGIPLSEQSELFQRFHQANQNPLTRDTTHGSGLGLYISRKMARTMNGDVVLLQSQEGKGSTFSITIPRAT